MKRMIAQAGPPPPPPSRANSGAAEPRHDAAGLGEVTCGQRAGAAVHRHRAREEQLRRQVADAGGVERARPRSPAQPVLAAAYWSRLSARRSVLRTRLAGQPEPRADLRARERRAVRRPRASRSPGGRSRAAPAGTLEVLEDARSCLGLAPREHHRQRSAACRGTGPPPPKPPPAAGSAGPPCRSRRRARPDRSCRPRS